MQDLVEINAKGLKMRVMLGIEVLIALIFAWIAISMQFGSLLAENTTSGDPDATDIAGLSVSLAPGNPQAHNLAAMTANDPLTSVEQFETTVRSAPNDYRWRAALGRAYEQVDQIEKAEAQLKAAADLAPTYAFPRWHLGNFYLRQGREDEAIAELKKATANHFSFREEVFSLAWDFSGGDPVQVERVAAENAETRAYLSRFLALRGQGEHALRVWNQLEDADKTRFNIVGRWAIQDLYSKGNFPEALEIARQLGDTTAVSESISNPSFEDPVVDGPQARFGWEISRGDPRVEATVDSQVRQQGSRSLKVSFRGVGRSDLVNIFQTVIVKPDTNYTLSFWIRTEGLRSPVRPLLQIVSANDNAVMGTSEMFPPDSPEWRQVSVSFRSGTGTNAINIRTSRPSCGEQCTLTGVLWYDNFEIAPGQ
jgi:Flp pilus assembly protein TadD